MAHPDSAAPAPAETEWDRTFAARPDNVAEARQRVSTWLRALLPDEDMLIGDVALSVSEACTNVVMHAYPVDGGGDFHVCADRDGENVRVWVSDTGVGLAPRPDTPGIGLGLPLIASLTDSLEIGPASDGAGTVVAMSFSAAGAATRLPLRPLDPEA